jgi:hypothetical protein
MWNHEQRIADVTVMVWENLFRYVEDFIALAINFRLGDEYSLVRKEMPLVSPVPSWKLVPRAEADAFIKTHTPSKTI